MPRYNLKNNPELAKERHRQQNREWYKKHKEQKMEYQREYRKRKQMRKVIISMHNCQKCEMLKTQCPDAEVVVAQPEDLLQFARLAKIQSMPFVVCVGEPQELSEILK